MCLHNDPVEVEKFLKKSKNKEYVWLHKVVNVFCHIPQSLYFREYKYKEGWNHSSACRNICTKRAVISEGIHLTNNKKRIWSLEHFESFRKSIRVKCYLSDFIGTDGEDFVFSKVYLPKSEYKRITK